MQKATILLSLGGDSGNQVQKYDVTPSEVAVLRAIHGDQSVSDIEPTGEAKSLDNPGKARTDREDLARLRQEYGAAKDVNNTSIFETLFPGVGARGISSFSDLGLDKSLYKAKERVDPDEDTGEDANDGKDELDGMNSSRRPSAATSRLTRRPRSTRFAPSCARLATTLSRAAKRSCSTEVKHGPRQAALPAARRSAGRNAALPDAGSQRAGS
jgi:hypothetical protein